jgi:hypothetical protein
LRRAHAETAFSLSPDFFKGIAAELDEIADRLEQHPDRDHDAAAKLRRIAKDIRQDARSVG